MRTKKLTKRHTHSKETSNQAIITGALLADEALLKDLVRQHGSQGWERVYDQAVRIPSLKNPLKDKPHLHHQGHQPHSPQHSPPLRPRPHPNLPPPHLLLIRHHRPRPHPRQPLRSRRRPARPLRHQNTLLRRRCRCCARA